MDTFLSDIRYALRSMRASPAVIAVAVLSLAIGIAANVSIFTAVDVFMLRPLPYEEPDRLVQVYGVVPERGWNFTSQSIPDFLDLREASRTTDIAATFGSDVNLSGTERPERIESESVSWNYFDVLRLRPQLGRTFRPEEELEGEHRVAVISDDLWQRRFGGDPALVGSTVLLNAEPFTIIGVLESGFRLGESPVELWTPFGLTGEENRGSHFLRSIGRLRAGFSVEQANTELDEIAHRVAEEYPDTNDGWYAGARPIRDMIFNENFRAGSMISSVAVGFILLIACANVANLMLTRVASRKRELGVRRALGAGRLRIVRQLLTEAMMVATLGGLLGIALSFAGTQGLLSLVPTFFPRVEEIAVGGRAIAFAVAISALAGLIFGAVPALQSSRRAELTDALKEGGRGATGTRGERLRKLLVVAEVSLALVLLVSCALLVQGYMSLNSFDFGWNEEGLLVFDVALPEAEYVEDEQVVVFWDELIAGLSALPGVELVGGSQAVPFRGYWNATYSIPGEEYESVSQQPITNIGLVLPGYFEAMEIPLRRGRTLKSTDRGDERPVVVINEELARRHWPEDDPVGQMLRLWEEEREIVGVVGDTRSYDPVAQPGSYLPIAQSIQRRMTIVMRTAGDPEAMTEAARNEVLRLDPNLPIYGAASMQNVRLESRSGDAVMFKIMTALGVIALVLAVVGVYGVMSYLVSQRTHEVGIRMALGAQRTNVLRMVVRQGALLASVGVVVGVLLGLGVTRGLATFLFGVSPFDPPTYIGVALVLLAAALAATWLPALRATRVDPMQALRTE